MLTARAVGLKHGFRSGLEEAVAQQLKEAGISFKYEKFTLRYTVPSRNAKYTPDFELANGIVVETKGRFMTADRQKMILVKQQHPDLDIRLVFSNPNTRLSKLSPTTYAMWAEKNGFPWAKKFIPEGWLKEKPTKKRMEALNRIKNAS